MKNLSYTTKQTKKIFKGIDLAIEKLGTKSIVTKKLKA